MTGNRQIVKWLVPIFYEIVAALRCSFHGAHHPIQHGHPRPSHGVVSTRPLTRLGSRRASQPALVVFDAAGLVMEVAMHEPAPPIMVNFELPQELSDLVMKLLEKDPDKRIAPADTTRASALPGSCPDRSP